MMVATLLLAGCSCDPVDMQDVSGEGRFSLSLQAEHIQVDVETRANIEMNTEDFLIYLQDASGEKLIDGKAKKALNAADYNVSGGTGYTISAESCTSEEATTANQGWGAPHFTGESTFDVTAGQTTPVTLQCTLQNAGVTVNVQSSFTEKFPVYSITTEDSRSLVWNSQSVGNIAYYNTTAEESNLELRVVGSQGGWEDRVNITKTVTLTRGKVNSINLSYDDNSGNIDIDITTDQDITTEDNGTTVQ